MSSPAPRSAAAAAAAERLEQVAAASTSAPAHAVQSSPLTHLVPPDPIVVQARKKFALTMEDELLDYKHNHPVHIENAVNTLLKIFGNVVDSPDEVKFRQVKATSNAFKNNISNVKGGEKLMTFAGWKQQVVDMQKCYVFDGEPGSHKFSILSECRQVLLKALHTIHEKAERKRHEQEEKAQKGKAIKEQVMLQIEDDRADRRLRNEMQQLPPGSAVQASALPSERSSTEPQHHGQQQQPGQGSEEGEDE